MIKMVPFFWFLTSPTRNPNSSSRPSMGMVFVFPGIKTGIHRPSHQRSPLHWLMAKLPHPTLEKTGFDKFHFDITRHMGSHHLGKGGPAFEGHPAKSRMGLGMVYWTFSLRVLAPNAKVYKVYIPET